MSSPFVKLWAWPIVLGMLTLVGLIAALIGDGWWDALSAVTLGIPVAVAGWCSLRRQRR